jgi:hypothetical protein
LVATAFIVGVLDTLNEVPSTPTSRIPQNLRASPKRLMPASAVLAASTQACRGTPCLRSLSELSDIRIPRILVTFCEKVPHGWSTCQHREATISLRDSRGGLPQRLDPVLVSRSRVGKRIHPSRMLLKSSVIQSIG